MNNFPKWKSLWEPGEIGFDGLIGRSIDNAGYLGHSLIAESTYRQKGYSQFARLFSILTRKTTSDLILFNQWRIDLYRKNMGMRRPIRWLLQYFIQDRMRDFAVVALKIRRGRQR